jgi:hypothetical protein
MKKAAGVLAAIVAIILGFVLLDNFSGGDQAVPEPVSSDAESSPPQQGTEDVELPIDGDSEFTRDEFNQLSRQEQDEMMDQYIVDFWAKELGLTEPNAEEKNLSLEIFSRPYMYTLTEKGFFQLSKEEQEKAITEVMENCRQVRSYVMDVKAEAEKFMNNKDYKNAEAYYVHCLQTGRELSKDKDGLLIARLVGIACEKAGLNGLVRLYEKTGEDSNLQLAREQLLEIDREVEQIKRTAKEAEENR